MSEDGSKLMGALKGASQEQPMVVETYRDDLGQNQPQNNAIAQAMAAAERDTEAEATGQQQLVIHADGQTEVQSQYTLLHLCSICGKAYTQKEGLDEHMESHSSELHRCTLCDSLFIEKTHLDAHMRNHYVQGNSDNVNEAAAEEPAVEPTVEPPRASTDNSAAAPVKKRPFVCSECGKAFRRREHVERHMRMHTGERNFVCNSCGKTFSQKVHLENHMRIHTGERPYTCHVCGKAFRRKEHISRHLKTHTGERPFACSVCPRTFSQRAHLLNHATIHSGERPYACGSCGKTFRLKDHAERHVKIHLSTMQIIEVHGTQDTAVIEVQDGQIVQQQQIQSQDMQAQQQRDQQTNSLLSDAAQQAEIPQVDDEETQLETPVMMHDVNDHVHGAMDDGLETLQPVAPQQVQEVLPQEEQGGGDTKMVVVEERKTRSQTTQLLQGANGQMIQVHVANNNNNNTTKPGEHQVVVTEASDETGGQQVVTQVSQPNTTTTTTTTTDHSIHRCPLCAYTTTSVNEFCKHVVLHAEGRNDGEPSGSDATVTIQPAATSASTATGDKPQITIVAASGNGTQTVTAQQFVTNGQPQYRCGICGELFTDNAVLQHHLRGHQEARLLYSCTVCSVVYADRQQLESHMETHMTPVLPAQGTAPATTAANAQGSQAATTQATVNGETRQVLIQTAAGGWIMKQESTATAGPVVAATMSGDAMSPSKPKERPYPCPTCGKTFCQKAHLENHLRIHTGERPFACSMCGKAFRRKEHIGRHMRIHTGERPFTCTHCGKRFSQKVHLESHIRIHTGERPFSCSACGKTFTRKEHIERHIKTHTGERMFVCSQCGKSFNQKAHLESHMRTHTGERPYTCGPCGKTFRQRVQLERHARTHLAPGTEGILTTTGGQQVLTVAAVPGQQVAFVADPNIIQQLQAADGHTTITIPACTLCGKAFCDHMDAQQKQLIAAAAAQGATVQVLAPPGQHLVQESGQLQVVDAGVVTGADGTGDAVAQAVAQATGIEHDVSVQGMSVQEQVDKAISNAVA